MSCLLQHAFCRVFITYNEVFKLIISWSEPTSRITSHNFKLKKALIHLGAGEIRETTYLINPGNIFQEILEHFLRNTRIYIFIPHEWRKHEYKLEKCIQ
jgi:hypothetical protein